MRQQAQGRTEYLPGTIVFAKLKGYPWWPARIEADDKVPAKVLKQKARTKGALYTVFFYGSRDYGFFGPDAVRPFDPVNVENDLKAKKFKTKDLEMAVRQALNPSLLSELDQEEDEDEEEKPEEENIKSKGKNKVTTTKTQQANGNSKASTAKKISTAVKRRSRKLALDEQEEDEEKIVDQTAVSENTLSERKKRRKSMSIEKEDDLPAVENNKEDIKKTPEYKRVYHIRHRLQRLVYNKKEGEIPKDDYAKILQVVKEIEEAPMTYNLLKDTKIGKVVKAACCYPFEDDSNIKDRCQQLMRNWKNIFIVPQTQTDTDTAMHDV